jgi:ParB-like nuclease family protein
VSHQALGPQFNDELDVKDYEGEVGNRNHITRTELGMMPISHVRHLLGATGERPGEHRTRHGERWDEFKNDVARRGIENPIFVTVDYGESPRISEGNHRRDAAVELGMKHVPVEARYFGHAEQEGSLKDRAVKVWARR